MNRRSALHRARGFAAGLAVAALVAAGDANAVADVPARVKAAPLVPERVAFDSLDLGDDGKPVRLTALRYAPDSGAATRGAVIALHGCGGIYRENPREGDVPTARHQAMAEMLVREGYVVLFPDSFNPRGMRDICKVRTGERSITVTQRRRDVLASLAWLQAQPGIVPDRIALLGWSHGGSTTLATLNAKNGEVARFRREHRTPYFATAVAFYPGCTTYARDPNGYAPAVPLAIFMGEADDWTPIEPCLKLTSAKASSEPHIDITTYPGAHHGFDAPSGRVRLLRDVPNGVRPGAGVTIGSDPGARHDAYARLNALLRDAIGPGPAVRTKNGN